MFPELTNTILVSFVGVLVLYATRVQLRMKQDLTEQRQDLRDHRQEMKTDIRDLRAEMNERFRDQGRELSALRADVTQVALALGQRQEPQAG